MPSGYKRRIEALERRGGRGAGPVRVVTESDGAGGLYAFLPDTNGGAVELRPVRRLVDGPWVFSEEPGTPAQLRTEAARSDDDLLADSLPTVVVQHLGWHGAWVELHGGRPR
jgi:hypothetical protein